MRVAWFTCITIPRTQNVAVGHTCNIAYMCNLHVYACENYMHYLLAKPTLRETMRVKRGVTNTHPTNVYIYTSPKVTNLNCPI